MIGVHFQPGGAVPFLGLPAGELHNLCVSLDDLWGTSSGTLREQLLEADTPEAKFSHDEPQSGGQAGSHDFSRRSRHIEPHCLLTGWLLREEPLVGNNIHIQ